MYNPNFSGGYTPTRSPYVSSNEFADPPRSANRDFGKYELEHIATFSNIARRMRIPEDVLVQLRQLEAIGQLLSMRIILSITQNSLAVIYAVTGELVEQIPLRCVTNPVAFNGRPNLLIFNCTEGDLSEVHVFTSSAYSVNEIADRINLAKAEWALQGRDKFDEETLYGANAMSNYGMGDFFGPPKPGPNAPPAYARRYSTLLSSRTMNAGYSEQAQQFRLMRDLQWRNEGNANGNGNVPPSYQPYGGAPSARATGSGFETHMQVLNWCFDDIEKFVNQMHRAVQAFRELDRRVAARKYRNYMPGDGMLVRQARMPTDSELFDILQKFKFTLNLLGHVQHALTKPNAADVIQKLIPFLRTVVDASEIPGQQSLVSSVVSPLMTAEVVTLLKHCLTSDDIQFWRSLGEAWFVPSEEWIGGPAEPYAPRFTNGYKLSAKEADELIRGHVFSQGSLHHNGGTSNGAVSGIGPVRLGALANEAAGEAQRRRDEVDYGTDNSYSPRLRNAAPNGSAVAPNSSSRALEKLEEVNQRYAAELRGRGARAYEVTNEYTPKNSKEMSVMRGEVVEVLSDDRQWWKVRSVTGQLGYCPCTILRPLDPLPPRDYDETGAARAQNRSSLLPISTAVQTQQAVQNASARALAAAPAANGESRRLAQATPSAQYRPQPKPTVADDYSAPTSTQDSSEKRSQYVARPTKTIAEPGYTTYSAEPVHEDYYLPPVLRGASGGQAPLPLTVRPKSLQQYVLLPDSQPEEVEAWLRSRNFRPM